MIRCLFFSELNVPESASNTNIRIDSFKDIKGWAETEFDYFDAKSRYGHMGSFAEELNNIYSEKFNYNYWIIDLDAFLGIEISEQIKKDVNKAILSEISIIFLLNSKHFDEVSDIFFYDENTPEKEPVTKKEKKIALKNQKLIPFSRFIENKYYDLNNFGLNFPVNALVSTYEIFKKHRVLRHYKTVENENVQLNLSKESGNFFNFFGSNKSIILSRSLVDTKAFQISDNFHSWINYKSNVRYSICGYISYKNTRLFFMQKDSFLENNIFKFELLTDLLSLIDKDFSKYLTKLPSFDDLLDSLKVIYEDYSLVEIMGIEIILNKKERLLFKIIFVRNILKAENIIKAIRNVPDYENTNEANFRKLLTDFNNKIKLTKVKLSTDNFHKLIETKRREDDDLDE